MYFSSERVEKIFFDCIDVIEDYHEKLLCSSDSASYDVIREMYNAIKVTTKDIKTKQEARQLLRISEALFRTAKLLPNESLLSTKPFDIKKEIALKSGADAEGILNYLVYKTRMLIFSITKRDSDQTFEELDLTDYCKDMAFYVYDLAVSLGLKAKVIILEPGYLFNSLLYNGGGQHCFTVVYIDSKSYLVDCTYSQFFLQKRCLIDILGLLAMPGCQPGYFMMLTESRKKVAKRILEDGWIELSKDTIKDYLDGFTLYYRNGLYYELTGDFSFTTAYTAEDYRKFLTHESDQLEYEPEEAVGYQYRPLKDPNMKFDKR